MIPALATEYIADTKRYIALPTLRQFHEDPTQIRCIVGPVGCYSGDTEFLTPSGWIRFDQYQTGMRIAQWDSLTSEMTFINPLNYIKAPCDNMIKFSSNHSLSMIVSDEHRMPLYDYRHIFCVKTAAQIAEHMSRYFVPINFVVTGTGCCLSDEEIRAMVMFSADGSVNPAGIKQRVTVRKERKKERIEQLLSACGIEYTVHPSSTRPTEVNYAFVPPVCSRRFTEWARECDSRQLSIIVDEIQYWDGLFEGPDTRFSTTVKTEADFIQYAVHATGGRATISVETYPDRPNWNDTYIVHIANPGSAKATVGLRCDHTCVERVPTEDGLKYCFETQTGFLVVRHNGCVFISGNSGKTSGATQEVCYYLPHFLYKRYGIKNTRWVVVRNTYPELRDTTMRTVFDWFPIGDHNKQENIYVIEYPNGITVELLFRSCDNPKHVKHFKSLEVTGYWIDESIEVSGDVKRMLKNRIGRYPQQCPVRFGIETTNPPDVDHDTYWEFDWGDTPPPGPVPEKAPKPNHRGFWQPPGENVKNLRPGYYTDLRSDYTGCQDWIDTYIEGKPGMIIQGKPVYHNFRRHLHVAKQPLIWAKGKLWRGFDNSGNIPACVVVQMPTPRQVQVLAEFWSDRMGIVEFGNWVVTECNLRFPGAMYEDWEDPAGENKFSKKEGGFTSNAQMMREECGISVTPSEQNPVVRIASVERQLSLIDGLLIDPSCRRLINGFIGGYHYKEIGTSGIYSTAPEKNLFSHIHDSLQYVMVKLTGGVTGNSGFTPNREKTGSAPSNVRNMSGFRARRR